MNAAELQEPYFPPVATFTQGPWSAHRYFGESDNWFIRGPNDERVAGQGSGPVNGANAQAIAAIPLMFDALLQAECAVRELCEGQDPANQCWLTLALVREAIAKATQS